MYMMHGCLDRKDERQTGKLMFHHKKIVYVFLSSSYFFRLYFDRTITGKKCHDITF